MYSSLTRSGDRLGDVVEFAADDAELHRHAPLNAVIRFGKKAEERLIPVRLGARLTEIGTLETWCESKISDNRWRLQFELRKQAVEQPVERQGRRGGQRAGSPILAGADRGGLRAQFRSRPFRPKNYRRAWSRPWALGRNSWPLSAIRPMADAFLAAAAGRKKSPAFEIRWLNLAGFCLRPGFGYPGDDFRIEQTRRLYSGGIAYANQVQCEIDWWIFWGRVAGGLNRNQQADVYQRLSGFLLPRGNKKPQRINAALLREMWRTAASLELLPLGAKTELGDALVKRIKAGDYKESELWCVSRLGARQLFYGPINLVLPPATVTRWAEAIMNIAAAGDALAALGRRTDDATRDLPAAVRQTVRSKLEAMPHAARSLAVLDGAAEDDRALGRIFGEELPSGLVLAKE